MKKLANASWDLLIARVAGAQHGVITTEQLLAIGLSAATISNYVRTGRLHRLHRGVYAVGHTDLAREGFWMAAVLAGGPGAVLSHLHAAYLWAILEPKPGPIHITVSTTSGRARRQGLVIHRATLAPSQTTHRARIPVTRQERTLSDLHRIVPASEHRRALRQAEFDGLSLDLPTDGTRSELESLFLKLCRRHHLPAPEVNARLGPFLIDYLWRSKRLAVELDGYAAHGGRTAFEDDRARDAELRRRGFEVLRFTWRQVTHEPRLVASTVRVALHA